MIQLLEKGSRTHVTGQGSIVQQTATRRVKHHAGGTVETKAFEQHAGSIVAGRDVNADERKGRQSVAHLGIAQGVVFKLLAADAPIGIDIDKDGFLAVA